MKNKYDFLNIEKGRYKIWLERNYFETEKNINKPNFTIVIPPPNITGKLHLGHAWNNILQDILIRRKKMLGFNVLFLPGMDHAGIATQRKIKQKLKKEGFSENNLTKEIFLKYANLWKKKYAENIRFQWSSLGLSLDYKNEKFTLDKELCEVVEKVFIKLYKDNFIYRDYKIINWDSELQTTLSNVEVSYKEINGKLFYLKYFISQNEIKETIDKNFFLEVATTRPETIFADQALMINPLDKRYQNLVGKKFFIPNTKIEIPLIIDNSVDINFGTGVVKVTPAHDENDFKVGKKNNLKNVSCINKNGTMNDNALQYKNLKILECREKLIEELNFKNFVTKIEDYKHSVGFSTISGSMIEPRLSFQWFLKTKKLALFCLKKHKINFFPKRFLNIFNNWLSNFEDWCISRQLWWGHPIPAWYKNNEIKIQSEDPGNGFIKELDVLDTWFSSSLWPLSVLGWNNDVNEFSLFKNRFPLDVLVTGYDILTFWVSKMVLQSMYLTKQIPFKDVCLHGLVRDIKGQKMSKSKGNGIDPIHIINKYGTDSLRWFLSTNSSMGSDLYFDENKVKNSWNFINKIWNISVLIKNNILTNKTDFKKEFLLLPEKALLTQLFQLIKKHNLLYEYYEFNTIGTELYHFIWEDFSNWVLEFLKFSLKEKQNNNINTHKFLLYVLENILKLLHPFIPFVTDFIYESLTQKSILHSQWPKIDYNDQESLKEFNCLKKIIIQMRHFRQSYNLSSKQIFKLYIEAPKLQINKLEILINSLKKFLKASEIELVENIKDNNKYFCLFTEDYFSLFIEKQIFLNLNKGQMKNNFLERKKNILFEVKRSENILNNKMFLKKASSEKIQEEKEKYRKYLEQYNNLVKNITNVDEE
ncbi:valine--tRNA ligase [Texas Phoenix palm phytoplasma]|uniref:Valine--tRNA ligase n=1 Tax=Texas Phoenix palm phytoplasma TaxID=176709 RepID=A0ABS5BIG4_9MOLU|nr:valine--tRNA ligase [Texas Phoenix palm phytoplasma]MBP3059379.1 valine--tRNA ligase [Texas Phoenix palm phytoplasma]